MNWIDRKETPKENCMVIVNSSRGVRMAHWMSDIEKFQDASSSDNEGMLGWCDIPFEVFHWMPLPQPPEAQ